MAARSGANDLPDETQPDYHCRSTAPQSRDVQSSYNQGASDMLCSAVVVLRIKIDQRVTSFASDIANVNGAHNADVKERLC